MKYLPLANRVFFDEIEEDKRAGSLWIPDIARKNKGISFGVVNAVGPGRLNAEGKLVPVSVKPGDTICFPRQAPAVLPILCDGEWKDTLMCAENDIIAVVEELPRQSSVMGLDGAPLSIMPVSMARPDAAYKNIDDIDRSVSDLRQSGAPPDVIDEVNLQHQDEA